MKPSEVKVKAVQKLSKPYEGADVFAEWHKEKTKSSMAEAFRDANYAQGAWRCNNEWDDFKQWCTDSLWVVPIIAFIGYLAYAYMVNV